MISRQIFQLGWDDKATVSEIVASLSGAATYILMRATNSLCCLLYQPFSFFSLQMWNKKRVKTGSWPGSVWCLVLVYFWRCRGRARAVSFLVFYSFLYKLEFDSEPLVTFTPRCHCFTDHWSLESSFRWQPAPPEHMWNGTKYTSEGNLGSLNLSLDGDVFSIFNTLPVQAGAFTSCGQTSSQAQVGSFVLSYGIK